MPIETADHAQDADLVEDSSISSPLHSHTSGGIPTQVGALLLVLFYIDIPIYIYIYEIYARFCSSLL
jgi:hypothetical protein